MGRITLGDIAIAGLLTLVLVVVALVVAAMVFYVAIGLSTDGFFAAFMVTIDLLFLGGGITLGVSSHRAGYPVLQTWLWGAVAIVGFFAVLAVAGGLVVSVDVVLWLAFVAAESVLALFFVVGLAGFLNARFAGMPTQRFSGTRPGGWAQPTPIYKSNQPVIYQGIRELDFDDNAPGSLYRQRQ